MTIWVPYKKCDDPSLVWWGHFLGQGISIQTRNGRRQRIIFAGMRHTAVCETLIFSIDKKETTSTKEKRNQIALWMIPCEGLFATYDCFRSLPH